MSGPTIVIEPGKSYRDYWRDIWRFRELFVILAWRDVSVRYKQTVLGVAWAIVRPLLSMILLTVIFDKVAGLPSEEGVPYALMVFIGLMTWTLTTQAMSAASESLMGNIGLIGKVYFPRMVVPIAAMVTAMIDFLFSAAILVVMLAYFGFLPSPNAVFLPLIILLAFGASLGPGLLFAALNVKYRDFRMIIPVFVQFGLYVSPIGYSSSLIPEHWRLVYSLNPMVGVVDGMRWAILGTPIYAPSLLISIAFILLLVALGVIRFRRMEKTFADII